MLDALLDWDSKIFIYLNSLGSSKYDFFWLAVTQLLPWVPILILFLVLFFLKNKKRQAWFMVLWVILLMLFVITVTDLSKEVFMRLRPNNDPQLNSFIRILQNTPGYSFFSGHASMSFSITTLVVLFLRKHFSWVYLYFTWPLLFAISRVYVGVHYPLDVLVGSVMGVLSALLFYKLYHVLFYSTQR